MNVDDKFLDDMFSGSNDRLDDETWKKASSGNRGFTSFYKLNDGEQGLIAFLSEGWDAMLHTIKETVAGKDAYSTILQKPNHCELDDVNKASMRRIFMILDLANQYEDKKTRELIRKPQIKFLVANNATKNAIEVAMKHPRQGHGTLLGWKWETVRLGTNQNTVYNLQVDDKVDVASVLSEMRLYDTKEGKKEFPWIFQPDWPEYQEGLAPELCSVYTRKKMKPEIEMDWSNPELAQRWLKLHFLNTPQSDYLRLSGRPVTVSNKASAPVAPRPTTTTTKPAPAKASEAMPKKSAPVEPEMEDGVPEEDSESGDDGW